MYVFLLHCIYIILGGNSNLINVSLSMKLHPRSSVLVCCRNRFELDLQKQNYLFAIKLKYMCNIWVQ